MKHAPKKACRPRGKRSWRARNIHSTTHGADMDPLAGRIRVCKQVILLAGAGGFEPPYGGIKIRCLTTWLRPNGVSGGKLTGKLFRGNKTAGGAPPERLG